MLLCSIRGDDASGEQLEQLAQSAGLDTKGLFLDPQRPTTCKTRVLAAGHHMLRVDEEVQTPLSDKQSNDLLQAIQDQLPGCQLLIFQDYDKGVLGPDLISKTIATARKYEVPVAVDPKRRQFFDYRGATLFKPNLKEFEESMHFSWPRGSVDALRKSVRRLRKRMQLEEVLVTLSAHGMYAQSEQEEHYEPAHRRQIVDVSGAGDAVISVAALSKACGLPMAQALALANLAGGLVCETPGVVPITARQLAEEASTTTPSRGYSLGFFFQIVPSLYRS